MVKLQVTAYTFVLNILSLYFGFPSLIFLFYVASCLMCVQSVV